MGIWERLGNVIKSYLNDDDNEEKIPGNRPAGERYPRGRGDPDFDAAYEELDDFLGGKDAKSKDPDSARENFENGQESWEKAGRKPRPVPEEIRKAFEELGLTPEASAGECKEAYKKLLKIHHPDRHTKHDGNMKKATEKSARVNAAYERLMKWFRT